MPNQTEASTQKETNPPPTIFKFKKQKTNKYLTLQINESASTTSYFISNGSGGKRK
jgi:hypothetical protein